MSEKTSKTVRIKWVRSGIGFTHHQKTIVRSLGLRKLNHTVVRPDTPQIRGIVAAVPHLLEIIPEPAEPTGASLPEYTVHPAAKPAEPAESTVVVSGEAVGEPVVAADATEKGVTLAQAEAPEINPTGSDKELESLPQGSEPAEASKE